MGITLSPVGEETRAAIVDLVRERERTIGTTCRRTRDGLRALVAPHIRLLDVLAGYDENGWHTWIELQRLVARALSGRGGIDAVELACDDLGIPRAAAESESDVEAVRVWNRMEARERHCWHEHAGSQDTIDAFDVFRTHEHV